MGLLKRIFFILFVAFIIGLVAAQIASTFLLRPVLERELRQIFKVPVHIDSAGANLFRASFWMRGISIQNAPGFKEPYALSARTVSVDLSLLSFLTSQFVVSRILFKDPQFLLEIDPKGESNFTYFADRALERFNQFDIKQPRFLHFITQYTLEKFAVKNGDFQLIDHSKPERRWTLRSISFSLARVVHPSDPKEIMPTAIYMNATVPGKEEGQILVLGRLNPFARKKNFDITASVRNLVFNQYSGLIPNFPLNFKEGILHLKTKAVGHDSQVEIQHQVKIEKLKFSMKEPDQEKQPLVLGLRPTTLAHFFNNVQSDQKPFEFNVQISGNLEDPNFNVWNQTEQKLREVISERVAREIKVLEDASLRGANLNVGAGLVPAQEGAHKGRSYVGKMAASQ